MPEGDDPSNRTVVRAWFGDHVALVSRYADLLATDGMVRGLIGPREVDRIWDRHLVNCAVIAELFPVGARVVDVGSGAGLPGLVLACVRDDLRVDLVDPLSRRTSFLVEVVSELGLTPRVRVVTGRAEDPAVMAQVGHADWVTARALAPLARLAGWCLPLLSRGGTLAALKGAQAEIEIERDRMQVECAGGVIDGVREWSLGLTGAADPVARAVVIHRRTPAQPVSASRRSRRRDGDRGQVP